MQKFKVALVGYGVSGKVFHGPFLKSKVSEFEVTHIVSSQRDRALQDFPHAKIVGRLEDVLATDVDLVVITTPNRLHFSQCEMALKANKNVIIEKPFVIHSKDGEKLIALAESKNLMLTVFQSRRWDGDFLTVKKCIQEKVLGDIVFFESHFDRFRPQVNPDKWREKNIPGSGILYDLGSHLIDQAVLLFGLPKHVQADITCLRKEALTDDYFHLVFQYENLRVILHGSNVVKCPGPRFTLHGTKGSFIKFGLDSQEEALKAGKIPSQEKKWGSDNEINFGILTLENDQKITLHTELGNYLGFYEAVYNSLKNKTPPPVLPSEALETIKLIEECLKSSTLGIRVSTK